MMRRDYAIIVGIIIVVAAGLFFFCRTDNKPQDGTTKIMGALKAQKVPVVAVTEGQSGANGEFLKAARAAAAGADRVVFIHINTKNPIEKEAASRFPQSRLPLVLVLGLDGMPTYEASTSVDAAALKAGIEKGLTKKPVEIKEETGEQEHSH
jgi:hypothetical protein